MPSIDTPLPWDALPPPRQPLALVDTLPPPKQDDAVHPIIIIGAGLAGCWLARTLAERHIPVLLIERHNSVASEASGNPAGIVKPFVTRSPSLAMHFHLIAHQYVRNQLAAWNLSGPSQFHACGVLQLVKQRYPDSASFRSLGKHQTDAIAGLALNSDALYFADGGWLNPGALCAALVQHPKIRCRLGTRVHSLSALAGGWKVALGEGRQLLAGHVVQATGASRLLPEHSLAVPLIPARGQLSEFSIRPGGKVPDCLINGRHYVIPMGDRVLVGATFERDSLDTAIRTEDHAANLAGLRALMPSLEADPEPIAGFAGIRATTPDRLPLVGPLPDFPAVIKAYASLKHGKPLTSYPELPVIEGFHLLSGLGSRGITTAPLCARLLADYLTGSARTSHRRPGHSHASAHQSETVHSTDALAAMHDLTDWAPLLNPVRFKIRDLKRGIAV